MGARRRGLQGGGPFPGGWDPNAPAIPLIPMPGGYPQPRAVPRDGSFDGTEAGGASPDPTSRIAALLERHALIRGRPGGSVRFQYSQASLQDSVNSLAFQEVARLEGRVPQRCVVYSSYKQFGNLSGFWATVAQLLAPRVLLRIKVGGGASGGASYSQMIVPAGIPVAVTGDNIYVDVGVFLDEWGDVPISTAQGFTTANGITTQLNTEANVFIAPGDPTITAQPTAWYPSSGPPPSVTWERTHLPVWQGPGRLKQAAGYASAGNAAENFLFFFDFPKGATLGTIPSTAVPLIAPIPLAAGAPFSLDFSVSTKAVSSGLYWALSTTSATFTPSTDTAAVWVERYSDLQVVGNDQAYP